MKKNLLLRYWVVSFGISMIILSLLAFHFYEIDIEFKKRYFKHKIASYKNQSVQVLSIGNSLIYKAMPLEIKASSIAQFNFLNLSYPNAIFKNQKEIINHAIDIRPDILIVQSDLFLSEYIIDENMNFLYRAKIGLKNILSGNEELFKEYDKVRQNRYLNFQRKSIEAKTKQIQNRRLQTKDIPKESLNYLDSLANLGTKILFVDFAISQKINLTTHYKSIKKSYYSFWKDKYNIDVLIYPDTLSFDHYGDYTHFNEKGAKKISEWLVPIIEKEIVKD